MGKTKIALAVSEQFPEIKSLKDCGYQAAKNQDNAKRQAQYAIDNIAGFPEDCPIEARAELNSGFLIRFNENNPPVEYGVVDGNYIPMAELSGETLETVVIGGDYAMSFTTHEFGRLDQTHNPQLKALVKVWRDKVSDYQSGAFKSLVSTAKKLLAGGTRNRAKTLTFSEWITDSEKGWLENADTRCRNANKRGDPTADIVRFRMARDAFLKVWAK